MSSIAARGPAAVLVALLLSAGCAPGAAAQSEPGPTSPTSPTAVATPSSEPADATPSSEPVDAAPSATVPTATPTPAETATPPLAGRTIVIDPGHNGGWTAKFGYRKVPDGNGHR